MLVAVASYFARPTPSGAEGEDLAAQVAPPARTFVDDGTQRAIPVIRTSVAGSASG